MDLVDQLRGKAKGQLVPMGVHTFEAAADEIEYLRARVAELEKENQALKEELIECGVEEGWLRILNHDDYEALERALGTYESDVAVSTSMQDQLDSVHALVAERDGYRKSLENIRANAESQLQAQASLGFPDDHPVCINARWTYSEANSALGEK